MNDIMQTRMMNMSQGLAILANYKAIYIATCDNGEYLDVTLPYQVSNVDAATLMSLNWSTVDDNGDILWQFDITE